jgi:malate synthase A
MKIDITDLDKHNRLFTDDAIEFIASLVERFAPRVKEILAARVVKQKAFDAGELPHFRKDTEWIRNSRYVANTIPLDLLDRRVEITGPTDRKMIINALNSGAKVFMADIEDSNSPTWDNVVQGQINLMDAVRKTITFKSSEKEYKLNDKTAVLMVRPRGWHMVEKHFLADGQPIPAALMDFGLYFHHNIKELMSQGTSAYFYLPKIETMEEARLWDDVFYFAEKHAGIQVGTIRATVLVETITLAFEMDETIWALKDHIVGLNMGRYDYIFSYIKKFANRSDMILPDRSDITMDKAFLHAYCKLLVQTCHKRGIHAIGGMAAQIPVKNDKDANDLAMEKVRQDKMREVRLGASGAWCAHPALVSVVRQIFDWLMPQNNQIIRQFDYTITEAELLEPHKGNRTMNGLRYNIRVGVQYIESWLRGVGCVALYSLMDDLATFELGRSLTWSWLHHNVEVDGVPLTKETVLKTIDEEMLVIQSEVGDRFTTGKFQEAKDLFTKLTLSSKFEEFLTTVAYEQLT